MKAVKFDEANTMIAKDQPQYNTLPAFVDVHQQTVPAVTCWELSHEEIQEVIKNRKIWLTQLTFGGPLQPISLNVNSPIIKNEQNIPNRKLGKGHGK